MISCIIRMKIKKKKVNTLIKNTDIDINRKVLKIILTNQNFDIK